MARRRHFRRGGSRDTIRGIPAQHAQTYKVLAPRDTHWRRATCAEVDCQGAHRIGCEESGCGFFLNGWKSLLPVNHPGVEFIRRSSRRFLESVDDTGHTRLVQFTFPSGQECFAEHMSPGGPCRSEGVHVKSLERPGIYVVRAGASPAMRFQRPEDWRDHFGEHLEKIADLWARG